ncbi:hypothetical protein FQA39_LY00436 [Lamprigera yunnana]|nr:hypothetical protein FQA39_LY00436 [Lamprigera yunnana]
MGYLKNYYTEEIRKFLHQLQRPTTAYKFFGKAYLKLQTGELAMKGFRETVIYPPNKNVFLEADFIATEAQSGKTCSQTPELNVQCTCSPSVNLLLGQQQRETDLANSALLDNESAVVYTSPPFVPTQPNTPFQTLTGTSKFDLEEMVNGKANGKTVDCEETDTEIHDNNDLDFPVGQTKPKDEDVVCMFCDGKFPEDSAGELWIMCFVCNMWAHGDCTGAEKDEYICDFCK